MNLTNQNLLQTIKNSFDKNPVENDMANAKNAGTGVAATNEDNAENAATRVVATKEANEKNAATGVVATNDSGC